MNIIYRIFRVSFFIFLDISGILLGVFLVIMGLGMILGWQFPGWLSWLVLIIGVGAFFLHLGHYLDLRYMRWLFGSQYFIQK